MQRTLAQRDNLCLAVCAVCITLLPGTCAADEELSAEPPVRYTLTVGDQQVALTEGSSIRLQGQFQNPEVKLVAEPYRVFPYAGIEFQYPRGFTFEADVEDTDILNWTMSGNDCKVMVFVMSKEATTKSYVSSIQSGFRNEKSRFDGAEKLKLQDSELTGSAVEVITAGFGFRFDVYRIPVRFQNQDKAILLVVQDSLDERGQRTVEGRRTLAVLAKSLNVTALNEE